MTPEYARDVMANPALKYKVLANIMLNLENEGKTISKILLDRELPVVVLSQPMEFFDIERGDYRGFEFDTHKIVWRFK